MSGQTKHYDSQEKIVEEYLRTNSPSSINTEIPFNLRGYISYIEEHHITNPDDVPNDVIESFIHHEDKEKAVAL